MSHFGADIFDDEPPPPPPPRKPPPRTQHPQPIDRIEEVGLTKPRRSRDEVVDVAVEASSGEAAPPAAKPKPKPKRKRSAKAKGGSTDDQAPTRPAEPPAATPPVDSDERRPDDDGGDRGGERSARPSRETEERHRDRPARGGDDRRSQRDRDPREGTARRDLPPREATDDRYDAGADARPPRGERASGPRDDRNRQLPPFDRGGDDRPDRSEARYTDAPHRDRPRHERPAPRHPDNRRHDPRHHDREREHRPHQEQLHPRGDRRPSRSDDRPAGDRARAPQPPIAAPSTERIAVFVDLDALQAEARQLGGELAYRKLLRVLAADRKVTRAVCYLSDRTPPGAQRALQAAGFELQPHRDGESATATMTADAAAAAGRVDALVLAPMTGSSVDLMADPAVQDRRVEVVDFDAKAPSGATGRRLGRQCLFIP